LTLIILAAMTGLAAGAQHVFAGPDHLAAVGPLAMGGRTRAWRAGLMWGLGHTGGVWVVTSVALVLRNALPLEAMSLWGERMVGVVLIGIGIYAISRARSHRHANPIGEGSTFDDDSRLHGISSKGASENEGATGGLSASASPRWRQTRGHTASASPKRHSSRRSTAHGQKHWPQAASGAKRTHDHGLLSVGALHGLAGTSHLMAVLPTLAMPSMGGSIAYVAGFGGGSIIAMTAFASGAGWLANRAAGNGEKTHRRLITTTGVATIAIGAFWLKTTFAA